MAFDDIRLPDNIEAGAKGGPSFKTTVATFGNGRETRNANWSRQRMLYDIGYGIQNYSDYAAVLAFFYARKGRAVGFRFKDWGDYQAVGQVIGHGDGTTKLFQLSKTYADAVRPYTRRVTRPVVGTLSVFDNGNPVTFSAPPVLGAVTLDAAPAGVVTASFEFDVPVRFDVDEMDLDMPTELAAVISGLKLIELIE